MRDHFTLASLAISRRAPGSRGERATARALIYLASRDSSAVAFGGRRRIHSLATWTVRPRGSACRTVSPAWRSASCSWRHVLLDGSLRSLAVLGGAVGSFCELNFHTRRRHGSLQLLSRFMLRAPMRAHRASAHVSLVQCRAPPNHGVGCKAVVYRVRVMVGAAQACLV